MTGIWQPWLPPQRHGVWRDKKVLQGQTRGQTYRGRNAAKKVQSQFTPQLNEKTHYGRLCDHGVSVLLERTPSLSDCYPSPHAGVKDQTVAPVWPGLSTPMGISHHPFA